jgi:hypothetical protein
MLGLDVNDKLQKYWIEYLPPGYAIFSVQRANKDRQDHYLHGRLAHILGMYTADELTIPNLQAAHTYSDRQPNSCSMPNGYGKLVPVPVNVCIAPVGFTVPRAILARYMPTEGSLAVKAFNERERLDSGHQPDIIVNDVYLYSTSMRLYQMRWSVSSRTGNYELPSVRNNFKNS